MTTSGLSPEKVREFRVFIDEFKNETDRAAVVLGAAKIDLMLYQILQRVLLPSPTGKDELLDSENPLGTFSSRIHMCHRLGLITAGFAKALHLVRKIRNSFAHELSSIKLESGPHRDRINELVMPFKDNSIFQALRQKFFSGHSDSGAEFRTVVAFLSVRLQGLYSQAKPIMATAPFSECPQGTSLTTPLSGK